MKQYKNFDLNYRFYAFVANLYLSPLQCGLQTAHVVADMSMSFTDEDEASEAYIQWATSDKVIIICGALNHGGVTNCYDTLLNFRLPIELPIDIFYEDEISMNGMATACGVVVPNIYFDAVYDAGESDPCLDQTVYGPAYIYTDKETGDYIRFPLSSQEGQFIQHIKSYRLA